MPDPKTDQVTLIRKALGKLVTTEEWAAISEYDDSDKIAQALYNLYLFGNTKGVRDLVQQVVSPKLPSIGTPDTTHVPPQNPQTGVGWQPGDVRNGVDEASGRGYTQVFEGFDDNGQQIWSAANWTDTTPDAPKPIFTGKYDENSRPGYKIPLYGLPDGKGGFTSIQPSFGEAFSVDTGPSATPTYPEPNLNPDSPVYWTGTGWERNPQYTTTWDKQKYLDDQYNQRMQTQYARAQAQEAQQLRYAQNAATQYAALNQSKQVNVPPNTPSNWINYWKAEKQVQEANARPTTGQRAGFYENFATPEQMQQGFATAGIDPTPQLRYDSVTGEYRQETPEEVRYRTLLEPISSGDFRVPGLSADPANMARVKADRWYRENYGEPQREFFEPTGVLGNTGAQPEVDPVTGQFVDPNFESAYQNALASWNTNREEYAMGNAMATIPRETRGPVAPQWMTPFRGVPRWNNQIDVAALGKTEVRPVSGQTWWNMAPSEQQGLQGLVQASSRPVWEDYMTQAQRGWSSPQYTKARQRVRSY